MDSRRRAVTSTYVQHVPYQTPPYVQRNPSSHSVRLGQGLLGGEGQWQRRFRQLSSSAIFMGRERATPLAGAALHYHKRTAEGCERAANGEGREDLIWRRKTLGRTHYLCLAQIRTLNFAFQRWMRCRCRRQQYMRHTCRR